MWLLLGMCNEICPQPFSIANQVERTRNTYVSSWWCESRADLSDANPGLSWGSCKMPLKILWMPGKLGHCAMLFSGKPIKILQNPRKIGQHTRKFWKILSHSPKNTQILQSLGEILGILMKILQFSFQQAKRDIRFSQPAHAPEAWQCRVTHASDACNTTPNLRIAAYKCELTIRVAIVLQISRSPSCYAHPRENLTNCQKSMKILFLRTALWPACQMPDALAKCEETFFPIRERQSLDLPRIMTSSSFHGSHQFLERSATYQGKFLRVRRGCQASQRKGWPLGKSGKLPGKSGKLPGNPWIAVKFHSERTSGEVAENFRGKFGELPGKSEGLPRSSGEPDSLPATRQICLQMSYPKFRRSKCYRKYLNRISSTDGIAELHTKYLGGIRHVMKIQG